MSLLAMVTEVPASKRPSTSVPAPNVIAEPAMIVPLKLAAPPSVAELPTVQKTLQAWAPLISSRLLAVPTVSAEPTWIMKTEPRSPPPSNVRDPVTESAVAEL